MPLEYIKRWLFNRELHTNQGENVSSDVGVMISINDNFEEIETLKKSIINYGHSNDIHVLCFINKKEITQSPNCSHYTLKNIKWAGFPKNQAIDDFLKRKFNKFYYLSPSFTQHEKFILHKVRADKKWGLHHNGIETYLDFMVDIEYKSAVDTLKEIQNTISKLTKNDNK